MNRKQRLVAGAAALFVLTACQPSTQDGGTPSGMPGDTMTTDTATMDTTAAVQADAQWSTAHAAVAQLEPVS